MQERNDFVPGRNDFVPEHDDFVPELDATEFPTRGRVKKTVLQVLTLFTASKKSFSLTVFLRWRIANMPASEHTLRMSAPVEFGHSRASSSNLHSAHQEPTDAGETRHHLTLQN